MATSSFVPRTVFGVLESAPRTYYLGHHAAAFNKMRRMLRDIDFVVECRDSRIPLTSRNPVFEDALADKERVLVYTKKDLLGIDKFKTDEKVKLLRQCHSPSTVHFSDLQTVKDVSPLIEYLKRRSIERHQLTANCMIVGMPNVGKSTLLNALRQSGVHKQKAARTGSHPGVTRKIGGAVKILEADEVSGQCPVYVVDTPGVFIPYVPDSEAMLKFGVCGNVKDKIFPPVTLADYLLFHINQHDPSAYGEYHAPTNDIVPLLESMARITGRLQKGGEPDLDSVALWMVSRWRGGKLGRFMLDHVDEEEVEKYKNGKVEVEMSQSQALKLGRRAVKEAKAKKRAAKNE